MEDRFNQRYISGDLPWDLKRPDRTLQKVVAEFRIEPCKAIDIGCGTGDNAIWLAHQNFKVTAIDLSPAAIEQAKKKAEEAHAEINFANLDFLNEKVPGNPYKFVFDRGCFHTFSDNHERKLFAKNVHKIMDSDGLWLSLIGNVDDGRLEIGPPKRTATEVVSAVEPYFEIISMKSGKFDSHNTNPSKIWVCLMKKRPSES